MGERLLCKQEVIGSIPFTSTTRCKLSAISDCDRGNMVCLHGLAHVRAGSLTG